MTRKELEQKRLEAKAAADVIMAKADAETEGVLTDEQQTAVDDHIKDFREAGIELAELDATDQAQALRESVAAMGTELDQTRGRRTTDGLMAAIPHSDQHPRMQPLVTGGGLRVDNPATQGFMDFGEQLIAVVNASRIGGSVDPRLQAQQVSSAATGMNVSTGAEGGFLLAPAFASTIWDGMNEDPDNLLNRTDNYPVPVGADSVEFPKNPETSRATGSRFGGVQGYWISEAAQITSSRPTLGKLRLEPQELAVLVYVTDRMLRQGGAATSAYVTRASVQELLFLVGDAIVNGTGAGQPQGLMASPARITVGKEPDQGAATIAAENIDNMWARLHPRCRANAIWLANVDIEPQLQTMQYAAGTGGQLVYMPPGGIADSPHARLKGRPIVFVEYAQTLGTAGDLIAVDLSKYATGTRESIRQAMSIHLRFDYAESCFRFMWEVDGRTWLGSPITPFKGTNTLSSVVDLATRA